ncbi:MAG: hypothetical protein Q9169_005774 [Polycauliona sp. 2 TL-2023]
MEKQTARELISQLERHSQEQIQCLQQLFGLALSDRDAKSGETAENLNIDRDVDGITSTSDREPSTLDTSNPNEDNTFILRNQDPPIHDEVDLNEDCTPIAKNQDPPIVDVDDVDDPKVESTSDANKIDPSVTGLAPETSATDEPAPEEGVRIPNEWAMPWNNNLLHQRIEERARKLGRDGGLKREHLDSQSTDPAVRFIEAKALRDLKYFTFERDPIFLDGPTKSSQKAFHIIDYCRNRQKVLDTSRSSDSTEPSCDQQAMMKRLFMQILAFTVPYFSVTDKPQALDYAPLSPNGVFSISATDGKYICERKFSVSWSGLSRSDGPTSMMVLSPLSEDAGDAHPNNRHKRMTVGILSWTVRPKKRYKPSYEASYKPPGSFWVRNNLMSIAREWEAVLDALDQQTTLSSSMTFASDARLGILFEDRDFSNSKRYFWALQSLRLFAEYIDGTLRNVSPMILSARNFDSSIQSSEKHRRRQEVYIVECREKLGALRGRIERKRQEVQSLSDGLFSASSVAEGRLAADQNSNIRLLALVTIAYLPLNLATSIYGMDALPNGANLVSYIVVTISLCTITYILVLNLRYLKEGITWIRGSVRGRIQDRKKIAIEKDTKTRKAKRSSAGAMA